MLNLISELRIVPCQRQDLAIEHFLDVSLVVLHEGGTQVAFFWVGDIITLLLQDREREIRA